MSDYLHKSGLNIMQAYHIINKAIENVEKSQEILVTFFETTSNFVVHANFKLKEVKNSVPKSF